MAEQEIRPFDRAGPGNDGQSPPPKAGLAIVALLALAGVGLLIFAFTGLSSGADGADASQPGPVTLGPRTPIATVIAVSPSLTMALEATNTPALTEPAETAAVASTPSPAPPTTTQTQVAGAPTPAPLNPTSPPPPTAAVASSHGLTGELSLCVPKASYATNIERICFVEKIVNTTDQPVQYGILGVFAANQSGGSSSFQTSWRGGLTLAAGCTGPRDTCGGTWEDGMILEAPGTYILTLRICYSDLNTCLNGGDWETLTPGLTVQLVDWTPSP